MPKKAAAVPSNDELNINLEKAKQVVQEKGVLHQEALKKMDAFEQDHCTTYEDFKELGVDVARPIAENTSAYS